MRATASFLHDQGIRFRRLDTIDVTKIDTATLIARRLSFPTAYVIAVSEVRHTSQGRVLLAHNGDARPNVAKVRAAVGEGEISPLKPGDTPFLPTVVDVEVWWDRRVFQLPFAILIDGDRPFAVDTRDLKRVCARVGDIADVGERERPLSAYYTLLERGFLDRITGEEAAIAALADPSVAAYCGFDPTADSLHVGSLLPIMALANVQRAGSRAIGLVGGATGLIGDPSGKAATRRMMTDAEVDANLRAIENQIANYLTVDGDRGAIANNGEWFARFSMIEYLRDIGARFSVNKMIRSELYEGRLGLEEMVEKRRLLDALRRAAETREWGVESIWAAVTGEDLPVDVADRKRGESLSYLEFSYQLLQGYDFVHLAETQNCRVQFGGTDQWGNILAGRDLGKSLVGDAAPSVTEKSADLVGITFPLLEKASGGKFGKTETDNVWLSPTRTTPFQFLQFWRNCDDADVGRFLGLFTFAPADAIQTAAETGDVNTLKEVLAFATTQLAHGTAVAVDTVRSGRELFGGYREDFVATIIAFGLVSETVAMSLQGTAEQARIPIVAVKRDEIPTEGVLLVEVLRRAGFCSSNAQARRLIEGGGVTVDDVKYVDGRAAIPIGEPKEYRICVGKKRFALLRLS